MKISRKEQVIRKIAFLAIYPPFAILLLVSAAIGLIAAWFIIPFGTFVREGDEVKFKLKWKDQ